MTRYALIVGTSKYENFRNLPKATNDAIAISEVLARHNYNITFLPHKLLNDDWVPAPEGSLTGRTLGEEFRKLLQERGSGQEVVIYIAGHGFKANSLTGQQKSYIAASDSETDGTNAISLSDLNDLIKSSTFSSLVMLLDFCYAGALIEDKSFLQHTKAAIGRKHNYCLIAACRSFEKARESERNGVFTSALLRACSSERAVKGEVNSSDLLSGISRDLRNSGQEVIQASAGLSIPILNFYSEGDSLENFEENAIPYRGLEAFEKQQSRFFFGRKQVIEDIRLALEDGGFVALVGSSGSGKSSVIRAGLIPWLEDNDWTVLTPMKPGFDPLVELKRAFQPYFKGKSKERNLKERIEDSGTYPLGLVEVIESLPQSNRFLLVIDQFEELLTLATDENEKKRFIELIAQVARLPNSHLSIAITLRADFLSSCLEYPDLTFLLNSYLILMPHLVRENLEEAIRKPAEILGYRFELGLLGMILDDVGKEKGCLPLLQFALRELWEERDKANHRLEMHAYEELGGVLGALNRRADDIYFSLEESEKKWAKQLFLSLIQINTKDPSTRQRRSKYEVLELLASQENKKEREKISVKNSDIRKVKQRISDLIDSLVESRLLVAGHDEDGAWVDLAHESLIEQWKTFSGWQQEERIRQQIELRRKAQRQTITRTRVDLEPLTQAQQDLYDWLASYIASNQHSPSIRLMMRDMKVKSPAPIQSRLEHLRRKGYIDWNSGQARTIHLTQNYIDSVDSAAGIPLLGSISTQDLAEPYFFSGDYLDFSDLLLNTEYFALSVTGDGMIGELINHKDIVIMEPVTDIFSIKNGKIVAAIVGNKTTLRYFYRKGDRVTLQSGNSNVDEYSNIETLVSHIGIHGVLVGVWRSYSKGI